MKTFSATNEIGTPVKKKAGYALLLILLCYLASWLTTQELSNILLLVLGAISFVAYFVTIAKAPEVSFAFIFVVVSYFFFIVPAEKLPVLRLGFGTVALLDLLILYPFFYLRGRILTEERRQVDTAFGKPLRYLFLVLGFAFVNGILLHDHSYREAVRWSRIYLHYLCFFVLVYAVQTRETFYRVAKLTTLIVVIGSLLHITESILGKSIVEVIGFASSEWRPFGYRMLNIGGQTIFRSLCSTGNFGMLIFFISVFFLVRAERPRDMGLPAFLVLLTGISILFGYGRASYIMVGVGLMVGAFIEKEQRRRFLSALGAVFVLALFAFAVFTWVTESGRGFGAGHLIWDRLTGIGRDVLQSRDTLGFRLSLAGELFPVAVKSLPFGQGLWVPERFVAVISDVSLFLYVLQFGALGIVFYVWILASILKRFVSLYRSPLSTRGRNFLKGIACYGVAQLLVLPVQDPFISSIGILLVVSIMAMLEFVARFERA